MQRRVTIACTAHFPRGTGLGNRLFYWARARVFCREHGLPMVGPRSPLVAAGPGSPAQGLAALLRAGPVQAMSSLKSEITSPLKNVIDSRDLEIIAMTGFFEYVTTHS